MTKKIRKQKLREAIEEQRNDDLYNGKTFQRKSDYLARNPNKKYRRKKK